MNTKDAIYIFDFLITRLKHSKTKFSVHPEKDFSRNRKISFGFMYAQFYHLAKACLLVNFSE